MQTVKTISASLFICCLLLASCATKKAETLAPATRIVLAERDTLVARLKSHVEFLSSKKCEGRLPFTREADAAVDYIAKRMSEIGLLPFDGTSYLQNVPLVKIKPEVPRRLTIETAKGRKNIERSKDFVMWTQNTPDNPYSHWACVRLRNAQFVFAGYGIVSPEYGKNDYKGLADNSNKIAIVMVNDPGLNMPGSYYFSGEEMTYYGRWTYKFEEAARQGFAGALIIHDDRGAGYGWNVVTASENVKFAIDAPQPTAKLPIQGWLSADAARALLTACGQNPDELYAAAAMPEFEPVVLDAKTDIYLPNLYERKTSPNVVAYIPAKVETVENVICVAHWDHIGTSPGATDNATGVAWLLETARILNDRASSLRKNIVFLCPTCEEKGMYGSEYYAQHPLFPLDNATAVINMDVIPLWGENKDLTITGYGHYSDMDSLLSSVAKRHNRYAMADPDASNGMFYRSDHLPFMLRGVTPVFAKGWNDNRKMGAEWSRSRIKEYWSSIYHSPADSTSVSDNYDGLVEEVELFTDLILELAK